MVSNILCINQINRILNQIMLVIGFVAPAMVSGHSGHSEDQLVDGIDNSLLVFFVILAILIVVIIIAYLQGQRAASQQVNNDQHQ